LDNPSPLPAQTMPNSHLKLTFGYQTFKQLVHNNPKRTHTQEKQIQNRETKKTKTQTQISETSKSLATKKKKHAKHIH